MCLVLMQTALGTVEYNYAHIDGFYFRQPTHGGPVEYFTKGNSRYWNVITRIHYLELFDLTLPPRMKACA